jgi:hypothetical protein
MEVLVLPRVDGDLVIKAQPFDRGDEFDKMCPEPVAPSVRTKDGKKQDLEDKAYLDAVEKRDSLRWAFICVCSLIPSDIEWDTVDLEKPSTWEGWIKELLEAGLSEIEVSRVQNTVMAANSLDEEKLKEARDSFVRGQDQ